MVQVSAKSSQAAQRTIHQQHCPSLQRDNVYSSGLRGWLRHPRGHAHTGLGLDRVQHGWDAGARGYGGDQDITVNVPEFSPRWTANRKGDSSFPTPVQTFVWTDAPYATNCTTLSCPGGRCYISHQLYYMVSAWSAVSHEPLLVLGGPGGVP